MNINTNNTVTDIRYNRNTGRVVQSQSKKKDKHVQDQEDIILQK